KPEVVIDSVKTAVGFSGEETAALSPGPALSDPAGQKTMPARSPEGFELITQPLLSMLKADSRCYQN
ncbi:MAG: hypothetical protein R6U43_11530, partial [Candidatus Krumholzibacteriales bacterium]